MEIEKLLDEFVDKTRAIIKDNLAGIYLHGSIALGCFHEKKSDIDLLVTIERPLTMDEKRRYLSEILKLNKKAPAKGLEMSVVLKRDMKPFIHPTPFDFHFSIAHLESYESDPDGTILRLSGTDRDLAAHVMIINRCGKTLFGERKENVFSEVKHEDYLDALMYDVENAKTDILEDAMDVVLSLTRVLAYVKDCLVLSKKDGCEWALLNVESEYHPLIRSALNAYETDERMVFSREEARAFADGMLQRIHAYIGRK